MRLPSLGEADLLAALYEGVFEQPLWRSFLHKLKAHTGASYATLIFRPLDDGPIIELYAGDRPPEHLQHLFFGKFARDPLPYREMREGRVYALSELLDADDPVHQAFYHDLLVPSGMSHSRSVRITEPSGANAWLSITAGKDFSAAQSSYLSALAPHLRIALRIFAAQERERFRSAVTSDAIKRLNFGWLTLDARCRIIDADAHAERLLERSSLIGRGRYDRLTPAAPAIDRELTRIVHRFARGEDARPTAINLSRDPWMDILVAPFQSRSLAASATPVAIAYLRGDTSSNADRCDQLVDLFGLLPSEARLAWAMARGLSINEAAEELGLTVETARNYSKRVYGKMGARGQADLVRTLLTSVLALA